jgi:selenocysteine lyase/cysteine desulfurase
MDKRNFIKNSILALGAVPLLKAIDLEEPRFDAYADDFDDAKWQKIRKDYKLQKYVNLENGYYCITPQPTLLKYIDHINRVNQMGSYYMRTEQTSNKDKSRIALAQLVGCSAEELVITRNTTESLDIVISGFPWQSGDEAIMANTDYGAMLDMFRQVSARYGVVNKYIDLPLDPSSDEEIVTLYEKQITSKTKMIMICHMVNITGHILPVRKICDMAHSYGVKVMVDGAHCVAHIQYKIDDLNCDFYGASLHKWLSNPLGCGMLYVRKEHIPDVWPLLASSEKDKTKINRLNHTGTLPVYTDVCVLDSINYLNSIGLADKENRLRALQNYWVDQVRDQPGVIINTPRDKKRSCGIANVGIKNMKPVDLMGTLYQKYNVYTVGIDTGGVKGVRVTPNVYTTFKELDELVKAVLELGKLAS